MIRVKAKGSFKKTKRFLKKASDINAELILKKYGEEGVRALSEATPVDTGLTAQSWYYEIYKENDAYIINWCNSNIQNGIQIAAILDLGHGLSAGGYIKGRNYIKPAIRPIFDFIADSAWREVTNA